MFQQQSAADVPDDDVDAVPSLLAKKPPKTLMDSVCESRRRWYQAFGGRPSRPWIWLHQPLSLMLGMTSVPTHDAFNIAIRIDGRPITRRSLSSVVHSRPD